MQENKDDYLDDDKEEEKRDRTVKHKNKMDAVMAMQIQWKYHCGTMVPVLQLLQHSQHELIE